MNPVEFYEKELREQADLRRKAVEFIKAASDLWYERSIELVLFRNKLLDETVSQILELHSYATKFIKKPISILDTLKVAQTLQHMELPPSKLDVGKLAYEFGSQLNLDLKDFLLQKLVTANHGIPIEPRDVVLYGFGRIGRILCREMIAMTGKGDQLRLRAIVARGEITPEVLEKRASLLRRDSVHGDFPGTVETDIEHQALTINGTTVFLISANDPSEIDYTRYGIRDALVIDNTGAFRTADALGKHLRAKGVSKVLLTAPGKGEIPNIVYGVNQKDFDPDKVNIFSAASCTTNAITPVLKVIEEHFGVEDGHLETIHSYTNDQNLVDNMHQKYRRGRAAALNMVITETGAGQAVAKALPSLSGKLTSNAIRVPVPNGSLAILNLKLRKETSVEEINEVVRNSALDGELVDQIKYSVDNELVSSDIVGSSAPSIYDSKATIAEGKKAILYVWYDNEFGYSHQVLRLAKYIAKVRRFTY